VSTSFEVDTIFLGISAGRKVTCPLAYFVSAIGADTSDAGANE